MKREGSSLITYTLYLMVILSLFLTWRILSVPSGTVEIQTVSPSQQTTNLSSVKNIDDVFRPHQIVFHKASDSFVSQDDEIVKKADNFLKNWELSDLFFEGTYSREEYNTLILNRNKVEINFPASIYLGMLTRYFERLPEGFENNTISRIIISMNEDDPIYLIDDKSLNVYTAERSNVSLEPLLNIYTNNPEKFIKSEAYTFENGVRFLPQSDVSLNKVVYLSEKQPNSFFINRLFDDTTELRDDSNEKLTIYSDNVSQLKIDKKTGVLYYYRNNLDETELSAYQQVRDSFHTLKFMDTWTQAFYFNGYDTESDDVLYRRYLNGLPISGQWNPGLIKMEMSSSGLVELTYPTEVIQTPLEDRKEAITVPYVQTVIQQLDEAGIRYNDIQDMEIAYEWSSSDESSRIATLLPTWFINLDGNWKTLEEWLVETERGERVGL